MSAEPDGPGARVARARRRRGLSQAVVAGLVGRSESWLSQVEQGLRRADLMRELVSMPSVSGGLCHVCQRHLKAGCAPFPCP